MKPSDLIVNGEIVLEGAIIPSGYEDWFESGIVTANLVRRALAEMEGDVVVRVNSAGGDPTEGEAIRSMLVERGGVTVKVAGDAMSAASLMIMGAARIEMSEGSIMMIHDPSSITLGTADDHYKAGAVLDTLADTYAGVYARRSGKSADEVRQIMKDELYMGPAEAVAEGFADAVTGEAAPVATMAKSPDLAARGRFEQSLGMVKAALSHRQPPPPASQIPTAAGGLPQASMAANLEADMPKNDGTPAQTAPKPEATPQMAGTPTPTPAVEPTPPPAPQAEVQAAVMAERQRQLEIRGMAAPFLASRALVAADIDALIEDGTSAAAAGQKLMARMAAGQPPVTRPAGSGATIVRDETDTRMEGMIGALMGEREGPAEEFLGLRLKSLAMEMAGPRRGYNEAEAIRAGMLATTMRGGALGVSDFSYITTEVMNRTLVAEYERRVAAWGRVSTGVTASDFRELAPVRFGGDFQLKKVLENGEYEEATLADEAEGLKVERRGRTINITFEAIVNDDMGAFTRIPREFAMSARIMEAAMVWGLIRTNAVLKSDSKALFHVDHKNIAGSGGAISVTTVGAGRKAMWEQRAFGTKDADDFMMVEPDILLVPPALETVARQFVSGITPAKTTDVNPFGATVDPLVAAHLGAVAGGSDTAWYLIASDMPPITHAYLDGYQAPTVQTIEGMNPDKVTMNARHIFGAAATEYRGGYKNAGA